jgi:hypothetical protein
MEAAGSHETSVPIYQPTRHYIQEYGLHSVAYLLNARIVEPEEIAVARERPSIVTIAWQ